MLLLKPVDRADGILIFLHSYALKNVTSSFLLFKHH